LQGCKQWVTVTEAGLLQSMLCTDGTE